MSSKPEWFPQVRDFCRQEQIEIMAWGPETLVLEAKSPEVAAQIAKQLSSFGFSKVDDHADLERGMLTLSLRR